jgi:hypothetical protein
MPRNTSGKPRAFTENDKRFTFANKINNSTWKCPNEKSVRATQSNNLVSITCECAFTESKQCGGVFDEIDAFAHFCDEHREKL